jgi:hypothetical protein
MATALSLTLSLPFCIQFLRSGKSQPDVTKGYDTTGSRGRSLGVVLASNLQLPASRTGRHMAAFRFLCAKNALIAKI